MKMTQEIRKILEVIINHYYEDIQWWGNDKEEQAYADVDKIVEWLKEEKENIIISNKELNLKLQRRLEEEEIEKKLNIYFPDFPESVK